MNPSRPSATHVAVRDGRIVAVGSFDEICGSTDVTIDDRFKDKVLLPGFVEGHSHIMEGMMWSLPYVGAGDRRSPEGKLVKGLADIEAIVARLKEAEACNDRSRRAVVRLGLRSFAHRRRAVDPTGSRPRFDDLTNYGHSRQLSHQQRQHDRTEAR